MLPLAVFSCHCDYIKEPSFILIIILRLSLFDVLSASSFFYHRYVLDRTVDEPLLRFLYKEVSWLSRGRLCPHPDGVVGEQWSSGSRTLTLRRSHTALRQTASAACVSRPLGVLQALRAWGCTLRRYHLRYSLSSRVEKKTEERATSTFPRAVISFVSPLAYIRVIKFENTIAGFHGHLTFKIFDARSFRLSSSDYKGR